MEITELIIKQLTSLIGLQEIFWQLSFIVYILTNVTQLQCLPGALSELPHNALSDQNTDASVREFFYEQVSTN